MWGINDTGKYLPGVETNRLNTIRARSFKRGFCTVLQTDLADILDYATRFPECVSKIFYKIPAQILFV